jgi:hypothetical protein
VLKDRADFDFSEQELPMRLLAFTVVIAFLLSVSSQSIWAQSSGSGQASSLQKGKTGKTGPTSRKQ